MLYFSHHTHKDAMLKSRHKVDMALKALKIRIYPNAGQKSLLDKTFGCNRLVYNTMLAERKEVYERLKGTPKALFEYKYRTEKQLKEEFPFLSEVDSISLQQTRANIGLAYQNFYRRVKDPRVPKGEKGFPKFKSKNGKNSFRTLMVNGNLKIDFNRRKIKAPKLGWISFRDNRVVSNVKIKSMTFSRTPTHKYYVSILLEDPSPRQPEKIDLSRDDLKVKGLDMSLTDFFVDENGESPMYDANYRSYEKKIAELERRIAETKCTQLKRKLRLRLARIHEHIANKRRDFAEKLSNKLVKENDVIVVETLSLKDMAKFRTWQERRESKDKSNHGKSVHDLGWNYFLNRLKTKADEKGKVIIEADKWFASTKTCNVCGYVNRDLTVADRSWVCPQCGKEHNRDQNAAQNLRDLAMKIITEGTSGSAASRRNRNHL